MVTDIDRSLEDAWDVVPTQDPNFGDTFVEQPQPGRQIGDLGRLRPSEHVMHWRRVTGSL